MEITTTTMSMKLINNCPKLLRSHSPLLQYHAPVRNSLHFPVISHSTVRDPRFVTCCLSNENTSSELLSLLTCIFFCGLLVVFSFISGFVELFVFLRHVFVNMLKNIILGIALLRMVQFISRLLFGTE